MKRECLFLSYDVQSQNDIKNVLEAFNIGTRLVASFTELLNGQLKKRYKYVFVDADSMPEFSGNYLNTFQKACHHYAPFMFIITDNLDLRQNFYGEGFAFLRKEKLSTDVMLWNQYLANGNRALTEEQEVDFLLSSILINLGFSNKKVGTLYLKELIRFCVFNPNKISSFDKNAYPVVSKKFLAEPSAIERSIRFCITDAYLSQENKTVWETISSKKPTIKQLTLYCVDILMRHLNNKY